MYARVASWENGSDADIQKMKAQVESGDGPPPGVPAKGIMLLVDRESGRSLAITLFETEQDLQTGHETLNGMSPDDDSQLTRTDVALYEVAVEARV
jgi:hypothetical protein